MDSEERVNLGERRRYLAVMYRYTQASSLGK